MTLEGVNVIRIQGRTLLLAAGRSVTHHVEEDGGPNARPAVEADLVRPAHGRGEAPAARYDRAQLLERRWSDKTLCHRDWIEMAPGEAGGLHPWHQEPVRAPTCGACLRVVEAAFPRTAMPSTVGAFVAVVAETVRHFGSAQVLGVPPEHIEALRSAIRRFLRGEGFRSRTYRHGGILHVISDDAWDAIDPEVKEARARAIADAISRSLIEDPPAGAEALPSDVVHWGDWVTGRR
mgnify:CR=1 FL=1